MESMFSSCDNLESLDLSSFNTKKVTYMSNMFKSCYNIFELNLTAFQTSNVIDMSMMFMNCESLKTIYVSDKFDVTKVSTSDNMFDNCNVLEGEKGTKFIDCYDDLGINKDYSKLDKSYAHVDGGISNPGYFTANNN